MLRKFLFIFLALAAAASSSGYVLEGPAWTLNRTVQMQLSLGSPHRLIDGFASFNASAADALHLWNAHLAYVSLLPVPESPVTPAAHDYEMSAFFSNTIFGDAFGVGTLAVTLLASREGVMSETDTIFNSAYQWDSYRGALRPGLEDFHRVALHEFGHTLGLGHPDEHGGVEFSIMDSHVSDIDSIQLDDGEGVNRHYGEGETTLTPFPGRCSRTSRPAAWSARATTCSLAGSLSKARNPPLSFCVPSAFRWRRKAFPRRCVTRC